MGQTPLSEMIASRSLWMSLHGVTADLGALSLDFRAPKELEETNRTPKTHIHIGLYIIMYVLCTHVAYVRNTYVCMYDIACIAKYVFKKLASVQS